MATKKSSVCETFDFHGEDAGVMAAVALRKVRPLAECAPPGRLFAAISTLADTSAAAAVEFEAAGLAQLKSEHALSEFHATRGARLAKRLKDTAERVVAAPLPSVASLR
jgi:hypothetical protein